MSLIHRQSRARGSWRVSQSTRWRTYVFASADDGDDVGHEFAVVDVGEPEVESVEVAHLMASNAAVMASTVGQG